jgi:soluble lytic murein transglycosylase-like protein
MTFALTHGLAVPPAIVRGMGAVASPAQVQSMIVQASQQYGVPPNIALAVASHESRFVYNAQNPKSSAAGVMQLMSGTQHDLGVTDPYDAQQNVNAGVSLLARFYQTYGNWTQALQAYSDGQGTVQKGLPPSQQTVGLIDYVNKFDASGILSALGFGSNQNVATTANVYTMDSGIIPSDSPSLMDQINASVSGVDFSDPVTLGVAGLVGLGLLLLLRRL